jgi:hypothetical protein
MITNTQAIPTKQQLPAPALTLVTPRVTKTPVRALACCSPEEQEECCAPSEKDSCCGTSSATGCGC